MPLEDAAPATLGLTRRRDTEDRLAADFIKLAQEVFATTPPALSTRDDRLTSEQAVRVGTKSQRQRTARNTPVVLLVPTNAIQDRGPPARAVEGLQLQRTRPASRATPHSSLQRARPACARLVRVAPADTALLISEGGIYLTQVAYACAAGREGLPGLVRGAPDVVPGRACLPGVP